MREYGADQFLAVAALAKDFCAFGGVLAVGGVVIIWPALVVEIVQKSGKAPKFLVATVFAGVSTHARLDG